MPSYTACVPLRLNQSWPLPWIASLVWCKVFFERFFPSPTITNKREISAIKRAFDPHVVIIFRSSYVNRNCVNNVYLKSLMFFAALQMGSSSAKNLLVWRSYEEQNSFNRLLHADWKFLAWNEKQILRCFSCFNRVMGWQFCLLDSSLFTRVRHAIKTKRNDCMVS